MDRRNCKESLLFKETVLPLEVVILLIGGMASLITGILLFPVSTGVLPYYENGLYGLFLVIFALQIITMGKTPFGDMGRSKPIVAIGVIVAAVGIATCFVPTLTLLPRVMLFLCLGPGGFFLLLQMCFAKDKLQTWIKYGGIFRHLIFACSAVYILSMLMAVLLWKKSLLTTPMTATTVLIFAAAIVYLAGLLWKIYRTYPEAERERKGDLDLSIDQAMILVTGVMMVILGMLLILVSRGLLPFSGSAQLGLLIVIFAVQMLASGSTPIGPFPRTRLVVLLGFLFAVPGIVSCIIPEILLFQLTILIGVLNILGGIIGLVRICAPRLKKTGGPESPVPPVMVRLFAAQLIMNLLTVVFGTSMLIPDLIHLPVIGTILAANGCVLLYLVHIMIALNRMQQVMESEV